MTNRFACPSCELMTRGEGRPTYSHPLYDPPRVRLHSSTGDSAPRLAGPVQPLIDQDLGGPAATISGPISSRRAIRWLRRAVTRPAAMVLVVYLILAFALFYGAWQAPTARHVGTPGDPPLNMWFLRWTPYALAHGHSPFFTNHMNFPFGANLMWNPLMLLPGMLLAPLTVAFGPILSYNVFVTANVVIAAWCGWLVARTFVTSRLASFVAGLVYGFSPYMLAQSRDHPSLSAAFTPPLLLLILNEVLVRQRLSPRQAGTSLGLLAVGQLFVAEEHLASAGLAGLVGVMVLCLLAPRQIRVKAPHALKAVSWALGLFVLISAGPLGVQFFGPQRLTSGSVQPPNVFVTDVVNLVIPTEVQMVAPAKALEQSRRWSGNLSEMDGYLGIPLLLLVAVAVWRFRSRIVVRWATLFALIMTVLSFGPRLHVNGSVTDIVLPWALIEKVPLLGHLLPNRLMVYVHLVAALLLAITVDHLLTAPRRVSLIPSGALVVITLVTLMPALPFPHTTPVVPEFFTDETARTLIPEGSVALVAPFQRLYPAEPLLWQAEADMRFRMPQGYFFAPDDQGRPTYGAPHSAMSLSMEAIQAGRPPEMTPDLRAAVLIDLTVREVKTVVVGPMENQRDMLLFFNYLFSRPPEQVGGIYLWRDLFSAQVPQLGVG